MLWSVCANTKGGFKCCSAIFSSECTISRGMASWFDHLVPQHMLPSTQGVSQSVVPMEHDSIFWHDTLPPECCSASCHRSLSRRSLCPCTSHWRGSQWTPDPRFQAACWRPPGGCTTSDPGPWTSRTWAEQTGDCQVGTVGTVGKAHQPQQFASVCLSTRMYSWDTNN